MDYPRTQLALQAAHQLGLSPDWHESVIAITPELRRVQRLLKKSPVAPAGWGRDLGANWVGLLKSLPGDEAIAILRARKKLHAHLAKALPLEAFCVAASVPPAHLLSLIIGMLVRQSYNAAAIIAALNYPRIIQVAVESAMLHGPDGHADRLDLHKHMGFLPEKGKGGTTVNVHTSANAQAASPIALVGAPSPEKLIREAVTDFHQNRELTEVATSAGTPVPAAVSASEAFARPEPVRVYIPDADDDEDDQE